MKPTAEGAALWICRLTGQLTSLAGCAVCAVFAVFVFPRVAQLGGSEFRLSLEFTHEARSDFAALWICRLTGQLTSLAGYAVCAVFY